MSVSGLILAIDQGTTNTKALLVGADGRAIFRCSVAVDLLTPRAGLIEQDPLALWASVVKVAEQCAAQVERGTIEGVAISNQRETALVWHRHTGEPLANAISWQSRRSSEICVQLRDMEPFVRDRTGLPLDPLISASKWAWLMESDSKLRSMAAQQTLCLGTVDSWLSYQLTHGSLHATDHSNASRTGLLNLKTLDWDDNLLEAFSLPRTALPTLISSTGLIGRIAAIPDLAGVPIVSMIGDSHAALAGHGRYGAGTIKATYGTGSSLMTLTPVLPDSIGNLARTIAWSVNGLPQYALEGNITMTGSAVQWVGEFLGLENPVPEVVALANSVADAGGVCFVPAMAGLGAPHWDAAARGLITGLGRSTTRAQLARAALESIAFQVADVLHAMRRVTDVPLVALHADGGAARNDALMQFQADLLQLPVYRSACEDLSALGAAWLGGLALGWWKELSELEALPQEATVFSPGRPLEDEYRAWMFAVARARLRESQS